jgi:hypothetical protein
MKKLTNQLIDRPIDSPTDRRTDLPTTTGTEANDITDLTSETNYKLLNQLPRLYV